MMPAIEQMLYGRYVFGIETGEWGPYEALTPTEKFCVWLRRLWGGLVGELSFGVVYSDLGDGGGVLDDRFVFQPPRCLCTNHVLGGYCRLSSCLSDILTNMM